ncbi:hypothetical protein AAF712_012442 [Marasmius tenuissimus]|uniref:Reverse transcriptase domain-containing protein n=1 Tax=Marasmius tenuissimus TaxID=585030 RepID=A0ABR2ZIF2_9AGAR
MILTGDTVCKELALKYVKHLTQPHYAHLYSSSFDYASIIPFLYSFATVDLNHLDLKQALVNLIALINKSIMEDWGPDYSWIDGLNAFQVGQGLAQNCFPRAQSSFLVSMNRINDLLCDLTAKGLALEYMDDYRLLCEADLNQSLTELLNDRLSYLNEYLLRNVPADPKIYPLSLQDELGQLDSFFLHSCSSTPPYLLTSQDGLFFLRSLNAIIQQCPPHNWWDRSQGSHLTRRKTWELALKCVAHINGNQLDYFSVPDPNQSPPVSRAGLTGIQLPEDRDENSPIPADLSTS